MVAQTIPMLNTDVAELSRYYDFVKVGRAREAGQRVKYCAWFRKMVYVTRMLSGSMKSHLPLRADLLDRDGEVLEQYRTISFSVSERLAEIMAGLNKVQLPEVLKLPKAVCKRPSGKSLGFRMVCQPWS